MKDVGWKYVNVWVWYIRAKILHDNIAESSYNGFLLKNGDMIMT